MSERKIKLQIKDMTKKYDNGDGVEHINLDIYEGEIVGELDPRYTTAKELGLYMAGAQRNA